MNMKDFPDASFLLSVYLLDTHSSEAAAYLAGRSEPLPVSALLAFEVEQAIRHAVFRKTRLMAAGQRALADWESDLASGVVRLAPVDWSNVLAIARRLSRKHTIRRGYRSLDILHVASALCLGAETLLSFDEDQRALAQAEDLKTN